MPPKKNTHRKKVKDITVIGNRGVYRMTMEDNKWVEFCSLDMEEGYVLQEFIQQYNKDDENTQHVCGGKQPNP